MTDSVFTGSVVVVGEVAAGRIGESVLPELPAVPDAGGEGEYSLADACPDPGGDVAAVFLERELAFERVVDRLDPLADPAEPAQPGLLAAAICSTSAPAKPLSPMMISPPVSSPRWRARSSIAAATSRSGSLAGARQKMIVIPFGGQSR